MTDSRLLKFSDKFAERDVIRDQQFISGGVFFLGIQICRERKVFNILDLFCNADQILNLAVGDICADVAEHLGDQAEHLWQHFDREKLVLYGIQHLGLARPPAGI